MVGVFLRGGGEGLDVLPVVMGCTPVSAMIRTRSGALWRAPPPLAVFRMAACMSWQAALWRLMRSASWAWHSPAM
jgi:hypothetical protein